MKGQTSIELGSKKVSLRITTGVYEDFEEYKDKEGLSDDEANSFKHQRILFALMELYANGEWEDPDILEKAEANSRKFKNLGLDQVGSIMEMVEGIKGDTGNLVGEKIPRSSTSTGS